MIKNGDHSRRFPPSLYPTSRGPKHLGEFLSAAASIAAGHAHFSLVLAGLSTSSRHASHFHINSTDVDWILGANLGDEFYKEDISIRPPTMPSFVMHPHPHSALPPWSKHKKSSRSSNNA